MSLKYFSTICISVKEESKNLQKENRTRRPRYGRDVKRTIDDSDTDYSWTWTRILISLINQWDIWQLEKKVSKVCDLENTVPIVVYNVIVHVESDSGVEVNVMNELQYGALKR